LTTSRAYITNLGKPYAAAIASKARIAEAVRDQEATEAEQAATAAKTAAWRDSQIKQAGYQAEVDQAKAKSGQAGPLAQATARQEVVVQETRAAELEADLSEQRLQSQVRKPADARAYEQRTLAEAERDSQVFSAEAEAREVELRAQADATRVKAEAEAQAMATRARGEAESHATKLRGLADGEAIKARGLAEADAVKAKGLAEADAINARAEALAENQEAVIAQQLAENWPNIVEASAKAFAGIDNMVVLNGADGIADMMAKVLTMGGAGLGMARTLLSGLNGETDSLSPNAARRPPTPPTPRPPS
jgi:regulator of protease activity HflC (stomatin/prohibitin superfamily)